MHVTVTKITNGYLVTSVADDGSITGSHAVLKTAVGNVPTGLLGRAVTKVLGKVSVTKKASRKPRVAKAAVAA